jgi:hypothetical protein
MSARQSWFERHPRKTVLALAAVVLVLAAPAAAGGHSG